MGPSRRGGRVAEGARLESVFTGNRNAGSNPAPSARIAADSNPRETVPPLARRAEIVVERSAGTLPQCTLLEDRLPNDDRSRVHDVRVDLQRLCSGDLR